MAVSKQIQQIHDERRHTAFLQQACDSNQHVVTTYPLFSLLLVATTRVVLNRAPGVRTASGTSTQPAERLHDNDNTGNNTQVNVQPVQDVTLSLSKHGNNNPNLR
jgi:hypothetical protein